MAKADLVPLPSPWLLREDYVPQKAVGLVDCTITTLALKPDLALDLLLDMPLQLQDGLILADSMLFWSKLALFSLELVAREQFVPAISEGRSLWKPVLDDADQERLSIFFSSIPPSCLASRSLQAARVSPSRLVKSFLDRAVDSLVRKSLKQTTLLQPRRGRKPRLVPLQQQFLLGSDLRRILLLMLPKKKLRPSLKSWTAGPLSFSPKQLMRHFAPASDLRHLLNQMNPGG